jgi:hypothetical protein
MAPNADIDTIGNFESVTNVSSAIVDADIKATVGMFDNVLFDNSFDLVRQFKNRSFLGVFFLPVTGRNKN